MIDLSLQAVSTVYVEDGGRKEVRMQAPYTLGLCFPVSVMFRFRKNGSESVPRVIGLSKASP